MRVVAITTSGKKEKGLFLGCWGASSDKLAKMPTENFDFIKLL